MAECPGNRNTKGTRSQFRLGMPGLGQLKGLYPIHWGDIMDVGQSSQTGVLSRDLVSPSRGTRTRTVREYEETIDELKKENFDLKLKLFMYDEAIKKSRRGKDAPPDINPAEVIEVTVNLNSEAESLQNELRYKDKLLQDASEKTEKYEIECKELEKKCIELQAQLSSLSELPPKEEYLALLDERESLEKHIEDLEKALTEKEEEIDLTNQRIEFLASRNKVLEEKNKKKSTALQGLIYKNYQKSSLFPDKLKDIVISAVEAAKTNNKEDLDTATERFIATLNEISSVCSLNESKEEENIKSPEEKCLKGETSERFSLFLPNQSISRLQPSRNQSLEEVSERNAQEIKHFNSASDVQKSFVKAIPLHESAESETIDYLGFSAPPVETGNLISFSNEHSLQSHTCSVGVHNLTKIETVSSPLVSSDLTRKSDAYSSVSKNSEESCQIIDLLRENEKLKLEIEEKLAVIEDLKRASLKEDDALKASDLHSMSVQTDVIGFNLLNEYEMAKLQNDVKLSSSVEELREDVILLLLAIEDKNKELTDVKQSLLDIQEKAFNTTNVLAKDYYMNERNELHERLDACGVVNQELLTHLKNLKSFMEDLLENKFNCSSESLSEERSLIQNLSWCLNKSLQLSQDLSGHLSVCEESKLLGECESFSNLHNNGSYSDERSLPQLDFSHFNRSESQPTSYPGTHILEDYIPLAKESDKRLSKESDGSQLCWRCWQQLNAPMIQTEVSHQFENNMEHKYIGYPSSESDIWSEPDRNISLQRIGISLQNSPVSSKSPRKLRQKEKRMLSRLSSDQDTSSQESHRLFKKRHGSISRRLSYKNKDFTSEQFYFLLVEKYSKLKSLLDELKGITNGKLSDEVWIRLNTVLASVKEAFQKLPKENAKNFQSAVCGKCVILELLAELKVSYKETDFDIDDSSSEQEILQQFHREICLLKEACKEPFSLFFEIADKKSQSTQSDSSSDSECIKITELENIIVDLNNKNKDLNKSLDEVKTLLGKEKVALESVITENVKLQNHIDHLKDELSGMKQKERELSIRNGELINEVTNLNKDNSDLALTLKELEEKEKESNVAFDQLTAELKKKELDLVNMNKKCLEFENELNKSICNKKEYEDRLKVVESASLHDKEQYVNQIKNLSTEKNHYARKMKEIEENTLALEQENSTLNNSLKSKNSELASLKESVKKLQEARDHLNSSCVGLRTELENTREHLINFQNKCSSYENDILPKFQEREATYCDKLKQLESESQEKEAAYLQHLKQVENLCREKEADYCQQLKQLEAQSQSEREKLVNEISMLTSEREDILQRLRNEKECYQKLMVEKSALDQSYVVSCQQVSNLKLLNEELKNKQMNLIQKSEFFEKALHSSNSECDILNQDLKSLRETLQNLELKCLVYEKELLSATTMKTNFIECLLNINKDLSSQRQKLKGIYKVYGRENSRLLDESFESIPEKDEDNVQKLCENLNFESKKLLQSVDMLVELLKAMHLKLKTKALEGKQERSHETEMECLKSQNSHFQRIIDETQKAINEKEKSIQFTVFEIQSLIEELHNAENEVEKKNQFLKRKDAEIEQLKSQNENLLQSINVAQKTIPEKENNDELNVCEIKSLSDKLYDAESKIDKTDQLLERKEAEIEQLKLQIETFQKVFNTFQTATSEKEKSAALNAYEIKSLKEKLNYAENRVKKSDQLLEKKEGENEHLKSQNDNYQEVINAAQKAISEKDKEVELSAYENKSLKEKLHDAECRMEKTDQLVEKKETEIEKLKLKNEKFQKVINAAQNSTCEKEKSVELRAFEIKSLKEKLRAAESRIEETNQLLEKKEVEINCLKSQNDRFQQTIDETKKSMSEKEKSIQFSAYEIQSFKEKLHNAEDEIEKRNKLLEKKEDEITMLQERLFNLQSSMNNFMADKLISHEKSSNFRKKSTDSTTFDSISSDDLLPSQLSVKVSKMCQTTENADASQSVDDSFSSTSTLDSSRNMCCEKYWKKCYSLQTKLALRNKHIEVLEKEKNDLRESFLKQLQTTEDSAEKRDSLRAKIIELESKLEQKKAFINELKGDLLKTSNFLIDREKELDDVKEQLLKHETKTKHTALDLHDRHSIETTVDTNIINLRNYKWSLIQNIFDIQKKFYEKRGIHLNYFERFKHHVQNLYAMQLVQKFPKSSSMPSLGCKAPKLPDQNEKVKNIMGLELDIECLENLKIFLNRFFAPCVLDMAHTDVKSDNAEKGGKEISSEVEKSKFSELHKTNILDASFPDIFTIQVPSIHKDLLQEKSFSFGNFASDVSRHLDFIENFFTSAKNCQWLESFNASAREEAEAKSLLTKIFHEIKTLHEGSYKLFDLNSLLKNFDFVAPVQLPINLNRIDVSDRESLMSEETIAVSRSESPLSFEDACPIKLPHLELLKLEEKTLKPESVGNRLEVAESHEVKLTAIGSSCDSVCQRSHYSSPDLGIESDPNHDSSAPEQKEDGIHKYQRSILEEQKFMAKTQMKNVFTSTESAGRWSGKKFGETLFAIGNLPHYELLKKEVKESLVAIKSVLSRTGDGLHHIAKYTSPRKTLEYSTLKSIKDTCIHIEVCLKAANDLVGKFWTAPCPSEQEWKHLNDENRSLIDQLTKLKAMIQKQESDFKKAMGKLEHAQVVKASLDKKISKKLVSTKKVIRKAERKLVENGCENFLPLPKYPSEQIEQSHQ